MRSIKQTDNHAGIFCRVLVQSSSITVTISYEINGGFQTTTWGTDKQTRPQHGQQAEVWWIQFCAGTQNLRLTGRRTDRNRYFLICYANKNIFRPSGIFEEIKNPPTFWIFSKILKNALFWMQNWPFKIKCRNKINQCLKIYWKRAFQNIQTFYFYVISTMIDSLSKSLTSLCSLLLVIC